MIRVDPVLRAAQTRLQQVLSVPIGIEDTLDEDQTVTVEYAPSFRPGTMDANASDLEARIRLRGVARGVGARRAAQALSEAATAVLLETRLTGDGWTTGGHRFISDNGTDTAGDLANATIDIELFITASPTDDTD